MTIPVTLLRPRFCFAVGRRSVTAVEVQTGVTDASVVRFRSYGTDNRDSSHGIWLSDVVRAAMSDLDIPAQTEVDIALLRPLCWSKVLDLPTVRGKQRRKLLNQHAQRFFPLGSSAALVAGCPVEHSIRRGSRLTLVAAARTAEVESITEAFREAGIRIGRIAAAPAALADCAAEALHRPGRLQRFGRSRQAESQSAAVVLYEDMIEVIVFDHGRPAALLPFSRRIRDPDEFTLSAQRIVRGLSRFAADEGPWKLSVHGHSDEAKGLARRLDGVQGHEDAQAVVGVCESGGAGLSALAAVMQHEEAPQLLPEELQKSRATSARTRSILLGCTLLMFLALGALLRLLDLRRETSALEDARRTIASSVVQAQRDRQALMRIRQVLRTVSSEKARPGQEWTGFFAALAGALPDSAYLTGVAEDSQGIRLSGFANDPIKTAEALRKAELPGRPVFVGSTARTSGSGRRQFQILLVPKAFSGIRAGKLDRPGVSR